LGSMGRASDDNRGARDVVGLTSGKGLWD